MRALSGPGLVIYPVTVTFAAVDWIMSIEAEWYSTMFPVLICIGQILAALSLMILLFARAADSSELGRLGGEDNFHKIGNLLLAFTMLWAYLAFGQLLVIWSGNLPPEVSWYLHRIAGGWRWVASFIALFQFFVPFFLLLMRPVKKAGCSGDGRGLRFRFSHRHNLVDDRAQYSHDEFLRRLADLGGICWNRGPLVGCIPLEPGKTRPRSSE